MNITAHHRQAKFTALYFWLLIVAIHLLFSSCGKRTEEKTGVAILAKVGDKTILPDEFIRRAEFTIRPPYCKGDNYIHRKIILNSLIAEKLLALEAGENNELSQNEEFQDYLRGRKEQAMRQWLFNEIAYKKVKVDTTEIKKIYRLAGRKYKIYFCSLTDSSKIRQFKRALLEPKTTFEATYARYFGLEQAPKREVGWEDQNEAAIHRALFTTALEKNQLIGPISTDDGHYLLMQIAGWTDRPALTDTEVQKRWNDVKEKIINQRANEIYLSFAARIMKDKKVEFSQAAFFKLAEIMAPIYLKTMEDKKAAFNQRFWHDDVAYDSLAGSIDEIMQNPLLKIDGAAWKVIDFFKEIRLHPLVFRQRRFSQRDFPEQLKLAIVDLIRDKYITQEAYKRGYDTVAAVTGNVGMWQDYLMAMYQKNRYLKSVNASEDDFMELIDNHLNAYVDSLQVKYHDRIEINTDQFEKIQLTRIDMFALQRNVPFPVVVPSFPLLTTDNRLDYGRKMMQ